MHRPLSLWYPLTTRVNGPQNMYRRLGEEDNLLPWKSNDFSVVQPRTQSQHLNYPDSSQKTVIFDSILIPITSKSNRISCSIPNYVQLNVLVYADSTIQRHDLQHTATRNTVSDVQRYKTRVQFYAVTSPSRIILHKALGLMQMILTTRKIPFLIGCAFIIYSKTRSWDITMATLRNNNRRTRVRFPADVQMYPRAKVFRWIQSKPPSHFSKINFNIIFPSTFGVFHVASFPQFSIAYFRRFPQSWLTLFFAENIFLRSCDVNGEKHIQQTRTEN